MACAIEITGISGIGNNLSSILVKGTLGESTVDCRADVDGARVVVEVSCGSDQGPFSSSNATLFADGTWEAVIAATDRCRCGGPVFARAFCATDRSCQGSLQVDALECPDCPRIGVGEPEDAPRVGPCNQDGTRDVTISAVLSNTTNSAFIAWFEPGHPAATLAPGSSPQTVGITPTQSFLHKVTFRYPTPLTPEPFIRLTDFNGDPVGCENFQFNVPLLEGCRVCPELQELSVQVEGCAGEGSLALVTVTSAVVPPENGCFFSWDFGDGGGTQTTNGPTATHSYATPGNFAISLAVFCNGCLMPKSTTVTVPACDPTDDDDDPVSPLCGVLTYAIGIAFGLAIIFTLLALALKLCTNVPVPSLVWYLVGAAWAVVAILVVISYILCKAFKTCPCLSKCDWLTITWMGLLIGGIFAVYLEGCCGAWMIGVGIGMLLIAAFSFTMWIVECKPSRCLIIALLLLVFGTIVGTAFSYTQISALKVLFECANDWVRLSAATIGGVLTVLNLLCLLKTEAEDNNVAQP